MFPHFSKFLILGHSSYNTIMFHYIHIPAMVQPSSSQWIPGLVFFFFWFVFCSNKKCFCEYLCVSMYVCIYVCMHTYGAFLFLTSLGAICMNEKSFIKCLLCVKHHSKHVYPTIISLDQEPTALYYRGGN